jgi:hypothetical protein
MGKFLFSCSTILLIFSSCGVSRNHRWKLLTNDQHAISQEVTVGNENVSATTSENLEASIPAEITPGEEHSITEASVTLTPVTEIPDRSATILRVANTHMDAPLMNPKKERSEIQKIQRSFRRQATWYMIFSVISGFLGFGMYYIGSLAAGSPFFLLSIVGLVAFGFAIKYMVKSKRIKKKSEPLNEEYQLQIAELRKMKKLGFWGVMGGLGIGILSLVILILFAL